MSSFWRITKEEFTHETWLFGMAVTVKLRWTLKPDFPGLMANEA